MSHSASAAGLPRRAARGLIEIVAPGHARFGIYYVYDVYLTPNGGARIIAPEVKQEGIQRHTAMGREEIIPTDAREGLREFERAYCEEQGELGISAISVGMDTIAQLYAQRALRQEHFLASTLKDVGQDVWRVTIPLDPTDPSAYTQLMFAEAWNGTVTAGNRR